MRNDLTGLLRRDDIALQSLTRVTIAGLMLHNEMPPLGDGVRVGGRRSGR
jgi:hypothetical protein